MMKILGDIERDVIVLQEIIKNWKVLMKIENQKMEKV